MVILLETVDLGDKIGHLVVVDIEFDKERATEREYMYNKILPPIIVKQKILEANEQSVCQLLELFCKTSDSKPKSYRCMTKSHTTIFPKKFIPLFGGFKISDYEMLLESYKNLLALYI